MEVAEWERRRGAMSAMRLEEVIDIRSVQAEICGAVVGVGMRGLYILGYVKGNILILGEDRSGITSGQKVLSSRAHCVIGLRKERQHTDRQYFPRWRGMTKDTDDSENATPCGAHMAHLVA
jgi:hypothetical protein